MTDTIERGEAARRILENELFKETLLKLEKDIYSKWAGEVDEKKREALWYEQKAVKGLLNRLRSIMDDVVIERAKNG